MGHKNIKPLELQVRDQLQSMTAYGHSKYDVKQEAAEMARACGGDVQEYINNALRPSIYSVSTFNTYRRQADLFVKFCRDNFKSKTLEECQPHVADYLNSSITRDLSAWTIHTQASALCKLYQMSTDDLGVELPDRNREDITRSRSETAYDKHIDLAEYGDVVDMALGCGTRRRELQYLHGSDLRENQDGTYSIHIKNGKGGKERYAPVLPEYQDRVVEMMTAAGSGRVIDYMIPKAIDVHSYRGAYAQSMYESVARDPHDLAPKDKYCCRGDKSGTWYDRDAMLVVSQALGHNRVSIIAANYLY